MLEMVLHERPSVVTFHFGVPDRATVAALHERGIVIGVSATTADEARAVEQASCDFVIAQGAEAGGHRGHFDAAMDATSVGTFALGRNPIGRPRRPTDGRHVGRSVRRGDGCRERAGDVVRRLVRVAAAINGGTGRPRWLEESTSWFSPRSEVLSSSLGTADDLGGFVDDIRRASKDSSPVVATEAVLRTNGRQAIPDWCP